MGVKRYNGIGMVTEDEFNTGLAGKLDKPDAAGNENDVLTKTADGGEVWAPVSSTGTPADSAMSDSSTNAVQNKVIKKYVDDTADTKANKDGYYEQMVVGSAKNLEAPITVSGAFLTRPTGGADVEAADGVSQILEAEGNSVKFNQLVQNGTTYSGWGSRGSVSISSGKCTVSGAGENNQVGLRTDVALVSGHKYYVSVYCSFNNVTGFGVYFGYGNWYKTATAITASSSPNAIISGIWTANDAYGQIKYIADGTSDSKTLTIGRPILIDLTAIFGSGSEPTTVEAFEAWLKENAGLLGYYPYTAGTVLNNCMEGIAAPGYNLLDPATGKAQIIGAYSDLYGNYYGIVGTHGALTFTDAYGNESTITPDSDGKFELTVPGELSVASAGADCSVFLWWDGTKKEYEPYELNHGYLDVTHIYGKLNGAGDLVQVYAAGMARVGDNKDYLYNVDGSAVADKVIGSRAYTSGDESDSTVITDGTTTYYHLTTELRYTNLVYQGSSHFADGTPVVLPVTYKVNNWSIESIIPQNTTSALVTAPPVLTCKYSLGAVDLLNTHTDEIADLYATKADTEGSYPGIISGNLVDVNGTGTDQEFVYRPTGGGEALAGNGNGVIQTIKGRTLVWNERLKNGDFSAGTNGWFYRSSVTFTVSDGVAQLTSNTSNYEPKDIYQAVDEIITGHKYYMAFTGKTSADSGVTAYIALKAGSTAVNTVAISGTTYTRKSAIVTAGAGEDRFSASITNGTAEGLTGYFKEIVLRDITVMFGAGYEPATVAEFEALFPESYYAYNTGTLLPFKGTGIKVTGRNQWDEQWEVGGINTSTGENDGSHGIRSKNFCTCFPNTSYYRQTATASGAKYVLCYDANKEFIGATTELLFTTPSNAAYFKVAATASYGDTYNHDICINLSNPSINGQYFPYEERTLSLPIIGKTAKDGNGNPIVPFPEGMNGTPTVYDVARKADGEVKFNYKKYDGTEGISLSSIANGCIYFTAGAVGKYQGIAIAPGYGNDTTHDNSLTQTNNTIRIINSGSICLKNTSAINSSTTEAQAQALIAGLEIVSELATPVPFTWDEPLEMIYPAPAGGTEAIIPQGVDEIGAPATAPLKATIFYSKDYVQTINDMPKDFDTTASIDALATALATTLSTALNGTFTITRGAYDESGKKYGWTVSFTSDEEE